MAASWEKETLLQYKKKSREKTPAVVPVYTVHVPSLFPCCKMAVYFSFLPPPPPFYLPRREFEGGGRKGPKEKTWWGGGRQKTSADAATMAKGEGHFIYPPFSSRARERALFSLPYKVEKPSREDKNKRCKKANFRGAAP